MTQYPESPRTSNNGPSVDGPIYLSHDEHRRLFDPICQLQRQVESASVPDAFAIDVNGVTLEGNPPAHLRQLEHYQKLGFSALRKYELKNSEEKTSVNVTLIGSNPRDQLIFASSPYPVDFAHHKIFTIRQGTDTGPTSHMNFDDLAYLLGEFVPVASFNALSDPRSDDSFEKAALTMGSGLEALDQKRRGITYTDFRAFNASDERLHGDNLDFITQRNAQLLVKKEKDLNKKPATKVALELSAPLQVHEHLVHTILRYSLDVPTRARQPLQASAKLILRSSSAAKSDLEWALKARQEDIEPVHLVQNAIEMIRRDHTDKR